MAHDPSTLKKLATDQRHKKLIEASRKLARVVRHDDPPPEVCAAREKLEKSLPKWLKHHGAEAFCDDWSDDHLRILAKIQTAIDKGGHFALAMPRGHGKTTILKWTLLYVMLTGRRRYVVVVAATAELAQAMTEFARGQLMESASLLAHYPHVCHYARATEGKAIKARYMLRRDFKPLGLAWGKGSLVLPTPLGRDAPYPSDGAVLEGHGLTGAIRGKWRDDKSGRVLRPDFVLLDDPQTRESGESESQCAMRERIIMGDVLGLAGPRKKIAAVMPCTVIRKGDLAHRFLNHAIHPEWQGETCRLVKKWPDAQETFWKEYGEKWRDGIASGEGVAEATKFYTDNRDAMDAGAVVSWPERVRAGELSAIQTAENLLIESGDQFWAEYQNEPKEELTTLGIVRLSPEAIKRRAARGRPAFQVPDFVTRIYASTDLNPSYAFSSVIVGFGEDQRAAVLWYGVHKLDLHVKKMSSRDYGTALYNELAVHGRHLSDCPVKIDAWALDVGGDQFDPALKFTANATKLCGLVAHGFSGIGSKNYRQTGPTARPGDKHEWCHGCMDRKDGEVRRWVAWNGDYWREVMQRAWLGEEGAPGSASLFDGKHDEFAAQVAAEQAVGIYENQQGIKFLSYRKSSGKNNFFDAMAQAYALAAYGGIGTGGTTRRARTVSVYAGGQWITNNGSENNETKKQGGGEAGGGTGSEGAGGVGSGAAARPNRAVIGRPSGGWRW